MGTQKLQNTDGFIFFDLADAPESVGPVRSARKILPGGAQQLARSLTYAFASFEMRRGGASAGINAQDEDRPGAIESFVSEVAPMVAEGRFLPEPGTRVPRSALAPLTDADPRAAVSREMAGVLTVAEQAGCVGAVAAAAAVCGGLEGRSVAIEGFGRVGPALAAEVLAQGGRITAVTSGKSGSTDSGGLPPDTLMTASEGDLSAAEALGQQVDVVLAGSAMGVVDHTLAEQLSAGALVPYGPVPFTARALAVLRRAGTVVVPDFIATAGPLFAWWPSGEQTAEAVYAETSGRVGEALAEVADHPEGHFLGAVLRAEAFLSTWQESLPFGRPLAA